MKRIGIDARLLTQTGVGTYLQNLLYWLPTHAPDSFRITVYVRTSDLQFAEGLVKNMELRVADHKWHSFAEQTLFLRQLSKDRHDLMHFTYFSFPYLYGGKYVSTVHDVTPLLFKTGKASTMNPLWYQMKHQAFRILLGRQIKQSLALMTPTQCVKDELLRIFGHSLTDKIRVTPEGISYIFETIRTRLATPPLPELKSPYLLYVGNCYPHKNIERCIEGFARSSLTSYHLVLAGPDDFFSRRIAHMVRGYRQLENRIHFITNPSVERLTTLYSGAVALIHPSLSEGFGLTLIEAAYFGIPIIASDLPVVRELLGDSFVPFDPRSVHSLVRALDTSITQLKPAVYDEKKFSFSAMAKLTADLYLQYA